MKDRIRQLMNDKAMSQRNFANELHLAEATLSGIFNGRTRPTNQTVTAIHDAFPDVNIQWLMFGEGDMYINSDNSSQSSSVSDNDNQVPEQLDLFSEAPIPTPPTENSSNSAPEIRYVEKIIDKPQRKITEIRIFFDDGTYETF